MDFIFICLMLCRMPGKKYFWLSMVREGERERERAILHSFFLYCLFFASSPYYSVLSLNNRKQEVREL